MSAKIGCLIIVALMLALVGCLKPDTGAPTIAKLNAQLKLRFENPVAHYQLGQIYQQQGDWNKAASEYDLAVKFDPVFWDAQAGMIKVLRMAGEEQKSAQTMQLYLRSALLVPEDSLALGAAFERQKLDDCALAAYEQALKMKPKSAAISKRIGYYYLARNNQDMAKTYLRRSFELDPYQPDIAGELGKMGIIVKTPEKLPNTLSAPQPAKKK
ncbi:MAG: tetratricopeptide repeat protein [Sedimentisphaerales bacterium]|nr:tetratricopeptide repeat protein [Sedimentisphaerales bacterium]